MKFVFVLVLMTALVSCSKPVEEPEVEVGYFNKLKIQGGVNVYLVSGASNDVVSTTLGQSAFHDDSDNTLFIQAGSGSVTISVSDLSYIWCEGCKIHVENQVTLPSLEMDLYSGDLEISNLIVDYLDLWSTGSDIHEIAGSAAKANISLATATSIEGYDFVCDSLELTTNSGFGHVNATSYLKVSVIGDGNTIYKGEPDSVHVSGFGTGTVTPF